MDEEPLFPIAVEVEKGKVYKWCGCGKSKKPPLCDKEHCTQCVEYKALLSETVYFCACRQTKDAPFCDGSHANVLLERLKKRSNNDQST